ncbi:MAG TPA: polyphenol oxidase family protein [Acidimicrobiales bacterium]
MPELPPISLVHWTGAEAFGVTVGVTTRRGGSSIGPYESLNLGLHVGDDAETVIRNRATAADAFGVALDSWVVARQVHGVASAVVGPAHRGRGTRSENDAITSTDILVTRSPDVTLAILVADCVPLALVDPEVGVLAAIHAGWRGTAAGAVGRALSAMRACGAEPRRVRAFLGPAVERGRYQVTDEVRRALTEAVLPADLDGAVARPDGPGHFLVDLIAANRQQLVAHGVPNEHIVDSGITTAHADFFSDRAQRPCGRFALLARLTA